MICKFGFFHFVFHSAAQSSGWETSLPPSDSFITLLATWVQNPLTSDVYIRGKFFPEILFLHWAPASPPTAHSPPGTTSKAQGLSDVNAASLWGLTVTEREVEDDSQGQLSQVPSHHRAPLSILMVKQSRRQHELAGRLGTETNT